MHSSSSNKLKTKVKRSIWADGDPFIWATGAALTFTLCMTVILMLVVMYNGLGVLWPHQISLFEMEDGSFVAGKIMQWSEIPDGGGERVQLKVGNRDLYSLDFRWVPENDIAEITFPNDAIALERREFGNFYGFLQELSLNDITVPADTEPWEAFLSAWNAAVERTQPIQALSQEVQRLSREMERNRLSRARLEHQGVEADAPKMVNLIEEQSELRAQFDETLAEQNRKTAALRQETAIFADAGGRTREIALVDVVRPYRPNTMSIPAKVGFYASKLWELLSAEPRESNTEGGLFPAIFGTVMLIFLMSILSFPLGVLAAIYLQEYAKEGSMVKAVHIAVNNLAGIPSIVYGIFGLGFFVYGVGGIVDSLFFAERLPTPTFGTGGILWASLTLGLLTVPVVIVATEEALSSVPKGIREASYALGATRLQTLRRTVLPMASPGIMTGFILAMARAAGEVAPLMITGVVKLAPSLPIDGQFPFIHLDRKFMHLGFHIYDVGFQSPNVEAAKPMVYVTTMLLVLIVLIMSSLAIYLRSRMKKRYQMGSM